MKYLSRIIVLVLVILMIGCTKIEIEENPLLFFWEEMDKKYVYFDEKHIDWDSIRNVILQYNPGNEEEVWKGFEAMIYPLKDRHVCVYSDEMTVSLSFPYFNWIPIDLTKFGVNKTVETDWYTMAQLDNNIVYLEIKTFISFIPDFYKTISSFHYEKGIIIDIRNNRGGLEDATLDFASNFIEGKQTVLYRRFKNGTRHNDFTNYRPVLLDGTNFFPDTKIILLTDNNTYSAANMFASIMKDCTNAILVGNKTGGGGANSITGMLPNGWIYSISENPDFDQNYRSLESGVEPHHWVLFNEAESSQYAEDRIHPQMEFAYQLLNESKSKK